MGDNSKKRPAAMSTTMAPRFRVQADRSDDDVGIRRGTRLRLVFGHFAGIERQRGVENARPADGQPRRRDRVGGLASQVAGTTPR